MSNQFKLLVLERVDDFSVMNCVGVQGHICYKEATNVLPLGFQGGWVGCCMYAYVNTM